MIRMHMIKRTFAVALGLLIVCAAHAQSESTAPRKIAIVSLIGDSMTIDTYRQRVGTAIDSNLREVIPLEVREFDYAALLAAQESIAKLIPAASIAPLSIPRPGSDSDPASMIVDGRVSPSNAFLAALRKGGFTDLVLVAKHRSAAQLQLFSSSVGSGQLQGIGFYVDNFLSTQRVDTGERAKGFIAPYVYIKLALIDLSSLNLVAEEFITASTIRTAAGSKTDLDPWSALSPREKVSLLTDLIKEYVSAKAPLLFQSK